MNIFKLLSVSALVIGLAALAIWAAGPLGAAAPNVPPGPPAVAAAPTAAPALAPIAPTASAPTAPAPKPLPSRTVSGGGVDVTVTPISVSAGGPVAFDVAMNSHSVEIVEDMVAAASLRYGPGDDSAPLAWQGPGPGGHHREGVLQFPPFADGKGEIVLIIRGLAGVPVREFRWSVGS